MSNQILCACGKHHRRDQPLVITITACPKKKHPSHITTQPPSPKKPLSHEGSQHGQSISPKESMPKKLVSPTGSQAYPTFVSPKQSNSKKNSVTEGSQHDQPLASPKHFNSKKPILEKNHNEPPGNQNKSIAVVNRKTDSYDHILVCEDAGVTVPSKSAETPLIDNSTFCDLDETKKPSAEKGTHKYEPEKQDKVFGTQMEGTQGTFFDPSHEFNMEEEHFVQSVTEPAEKRYKDGIKPDPHTPSDTEMKLPILVPRYHGPGCAMEVDVMEKHDHNCRYRKRKNPERNPVDDRSGSYEVIGRLKFKTCHPEPSLISQEFNKINNNASQNAKVATIYSLFNIPYKAKSKKVCLTTSESKRRLEKYLRRKKLLEDLTKSVKSFPNQSKKSVEDTRKIIKFEQGPKRVNSVSSESITSCEVEVLYFCDDTCSKSVELTKGPKARLISIKKWLYNFLPCVSMKESQTHLLTDVGRSSG